jgi:hypothetical protein
MIDGLHSNGFTAEASLPRESKCNCEDLAVRVTSLERRSDSHDQLIAMVVRSNGELKDSIDDLKETFREGMDIFRDSMGAFRTAKRVGNAINGVIGWSVKVSALGGLIYGLGKVGFAALQRYLP